MFVYNLHIAAEEEYTYEDQVFRNPVISGDQVLLEDEYFIVDNVTHDLNSGCSWLQLIQQGSIDEDEEAKD